MNRPLNQYHIRCSRQTLLFDLNKKCFLCLEQYPSANKAEYPIIMAIESGARYIEINVWVQCAFGYR